MTSPELHLVTIIGTGEYKEVRYALNGAEAPKTPYVARALVHLLGATRVTVLATTEAEEKHGTALRAALGVTPACVERVPSGGDQADTWKFFSTLERVLDEAGEVPTIVDVTHGFRAQPMLVLAVLAFRRSLGRPPRDLRILYGAYDGRTPDAPVWDLTGLLDVLDWAGSLQRLLRTGDASGVVAAVAPMGRDLRAAWARDRQGDGPPLQALADNLDLFAKELQTLRVGALLHGPNSTASRLLRLLYRSERVCREHLPALASTLAELRAQVAPLANADLAEDSGHRALQALARLYLTHGRPVEAMAVVREGWLSAQGPPEARVPGPALRGRERLEGGPNRERRVPGESYKETRNDLIHCGYRSNPGRAARLLDAVTGEVERFEALAAGPPGPPPEPPGPSLFVNLSNHPSGDWSTAQRDACLALATELVDVPFPHVDPDLEDLSSMADGLLDQVPDGCTHALVQGELVLVTELVRRLQGRGVRCWAATTARDMVQAPDGSRTYRFAFVKLRAYPVLGVTHDEPLD